ncbi:NAD(P)H-binding protein [Amycolatopsis dendrobii]|uniref:NAD(P)H-binding protein n=1 Tax=Amycolatopsis dendrobii TaxID=2760662 RepID=A0A7W3VX80_9PSEU|nr:NAD(P)H-binding protein [Amycolatopsis dendrobii]MBB1154654.1 NAD(P)H-binding protein [Amycolatopsis dendrobii]
MIVITAPTGNIGSRVLSRLFDAGEDLRVIVRDPARLPEPVRERVEVVAGSHGDPEVVDRAFAGADAVFWVVPPDSSRAPADGWSGFTGPAAKALVAHQVGHVVGVSALGRGTAVADQAGLVTASLAMDELIAGTGVAYRALANPSFFENLLEEVDSIREKGVYADVLDPDRKAPLVAVADIAAVAARLLRDRSWTGFADVPVLGPEDLSPHDVARIMSEQLGRPVRYERESLDDLRTTLIGYGLNEDFVHGIAEMKHAKDNGLDAGIARTAGTASETTFEQWCAETLKPAFDA